MFFFFNKGVLSRLANTLLDTLDDSYCNYHVLSDVLAPNFTINVKLILKLYFVSI